MSCKFSSWPQFCVCCFRSSGNGLPSQKNFLYDLRVYDFPVVCVDLPTFVRQLQLMVTESQAIQLHAYVQRLPPNRNSWGSRGCQRGRGCITTPTYVCVYVGALGICFRGQVHCTKSNFISKRTTNNNYNFFIYFIIYFILLNILLFIIIIIIILITT